MPTAQDLFFQNNKPLAVQDSLISDTTLSSGVDSYDLQDLREDKEFNETSERFLNSLGEGETVDELFDYFRGADWNLADATKQFASTRSFTDQQKQDYVYLRKKYSNADVGGPGEWAKTIAKTGVELITDPTLIASALFIPWSGGTSAVARAASGKAMQKALQGYLGKEMGKSVAKKTSKIVAKLPGQKLAKPLSGKAKAAVLMTEGAAFGGSFNYVTQGIEVETDQKEEIDLSKTAVAAGLSATMVGGVLGTGKLIGKVPSFHNSLINRRLEKIEMDPNYKGDILEKTADTINKALFFVQKPTSAFINKMARSPVLNDLINSFRHDASKRIIAGDVGDQPVLGESVNEEIVRLTGSKLNRVKEALAPLMPEESTRKKVLLPFSKRKFRKSIKKGFYLTDDVNNDLTYFLRTNRTFKMVNGNKVKLDANIIKSGKELQSILDDIYNESLEAGIKGGKINNYFPRRWLQIALEDSPEELIQHIHKTEKISVREARQLVNEMMAPDSDVIKIGSNLNSNLTKSRKLTKINDEQVSQYLDNDVMNVLNDYIFSATKQIVGKKRLGGNLGEFTSRFINPIRKQLAEKNSSLSEREVKKLKDMYLISTGQKGYIKSRVGRFFHNTATILAQTSLLPLATITSLPELFTPLLRGLGSQKHRENIFNTMADYNKVWWNDIKTSYGKGGKFDVRSTEMKELNGFLRAMDMGTEDRAMAAFGQGMGPRANKVQNAFFKAVGLQDWTKYVQLVSYQTGKNRIYDNLLQLSKAKENKLSPTKIARLTDELNEFNINPEAGLGWLKAGANPSLKPNSFYRQSFMPGAARYVDEVIMNPTAGANQKPLLHSLPSTRWAFGLMGFPTAFSNTVLKNLARDLSKDLRDKELTATPQILAALMTMTMASLAGNTIRTGGKNIEDLDSGEKTITDELQSAWKRAGLYGPFEYSVNYENSNKYNNKIEAGLKTATGPSFDDVYDAVVHAMGYDTFRGPAGVVFERMPFATLLRKLFPEKYKEFQKEFRKIDKETAGYLGPEGFNRKEKPNPYVPLFSKGGIVEGEDNVPFTKEDPADRINPYTGEPYQEQMTRLGFERGGETSGPPKFEKRIARPDPKLFIKDPKSGNPQTHRMAWGNIDGKFIAYPTIVEQDGKLVQYENNTDTMKLMKRSGNFKSFDTKEEAEAYADGGWKTKEFNKTYRKGFSQGGAILNYISQARGYENPNFLKQYGEDVKWQESRGAGPTTVQNNNGPARGSYQVEGSQGSSRNETILNRAVEFYKEYPDAPKSKEIQYALEQRGKDLDFSSLSEDTQDALFYMDAERGMLPLDDLASGKLNSKNAWVTYWNQDPKALKTIKGKDNPNFEQEVLQRRLDDWERAQEEKIIFLNAQDK